MRSGFEDLSERSRYMRFQTAMPTISEAQLSYFTDVDHRDHEALVAIDPATEQGIGVARFIKVSHDVAECAMVVADDWQGRGVATELLDRLVDRAREEGIERFTALVLAENAEALHLLEHLGDTVQRSSGPQVELDIALPPPPEREQPLHLVLAGAARGLLTPAISMWRQVADFAYHLMLYRLPTLSIPGLLGRDTAALGLPSEQEYVAYYCERAGRSRIDDLEFYLAFSMFRLAGIFHGICGRVARGNAVSSKARDYARHLKTIADCAWRQAESLG